MMKSFYTDFHATVENTANADRATAGLEREIGTDPASGKKVTAKMGRYGAYVQIGTAEDTEKPVFASLKKGQHMDTISLADALELFKLPRFVGQFEGKDMTAGLGRFGPFIKHDGKFYSLAKGQDPLAITEEEGMLLIQSKREEDARKLIMDFPQEPELKVLNGRWGPYIAYKGNNYKIPKGTDAATLHYDACMALIAASDAEGPKKPFGKSAPKKAEPEAAAKPAPKKAPAKKK
jgi:DNA topoisomerase-1